jgi:hypothetical protein
VEGPELVLGSFELRGKLGRGAMAVVWRAYDTSLDREVAIKEPLLPPGGEDEVRDEFARRFVREARAAARLNHPGIVTIYSASLDEGRPLIVMELVEGPTLRRVLDAGRPTAAQTFELLEQLLASTAFAHEHGVIHRDLKPDNVFVTPAGTVKLADFGIAHLGDGGTTLTTAGTLLGTPAYMAPEQIRGEPVDARCDVFALGVIAYECLAGANPFGSSTTANYAAIFHRILDEPAPALELSDPEAAPLAAVVMRALEKNREARFADAAEMLAAWRATAPAGLDARAELAELGGAAQGSAVASQVLTTVLAEGPATDLRDATWVAPRGGGGGATEDTPSLASVPVAGEARGAGLATAGGVDPERTAESVAAASANGASSASDDRAASRSGATGVGAGVRHRRRLALIGVISLAIAAAVLAAVLLVPNSSGGRGEQQKAAQAKAARASLESSIARADAFGAELDGAVTNYAAIVHEVENLAAKNAKKVDAWQREWKRRQDVYDKRVAAVTAHNNDPANQGTSGHSETIENKDAYGNVRSTSTKWYPGTSSDLWQMPAKPKKPPKVHASFAAQRKELTQLKAQSGTLASQVEAAAFDEKLASVDSAVTEGVKLLEQAVDHSKTVLSKAIVHKSGVGDVVSEGQLGTLSAATLEAGVSMIRERLLDVMTTNGMSPGKWSWVGGSR